MTEKDSWLCLCSAENIYQQDIKKLLLKYTSCEELYELSDSEIRNITCISTDKRESVIKSKDPKRLDKLKDTLSRGNIRFICPADSEYPPCFRVMDGMPYSLYVKGNLPDISMPSVGMVGARACSGYGREKASEIAGRLAAAGVQIVSGMAVGIDAISAKAAIAAGGRTFAVLGCGVDVIYPKENIELYYDILLHGGGIISEFPPGTRPYAWQFPHRNRIISALSDRLLVIEAGKHSGTLSTAMHALNQGRDVYALPGRTIDRLSEGCNSLIYDGAGVFLDTDIFISDLFSSPRWERHTYNCEGEHKAETLPEASLESASGSMVLYRCFGRDPLNGDMLAQKSHLSSDKIREYLAELEIEGLIKHVSGDYYEKCN